MREVRLQDAEAIFSAIVEDASNGSPSIIMRHGKREAVVVSYAEWERLARVPSFGRLLMSSPLEAGGIADRGSLG